jgi:hypothetical protein
MVPELSEADLQRPRTQAELRAWVDQRHDQFGRTEEGKRAVRLNKGNLVKEFIEEVWPLALFADAFYKGREDFLFRSFLGCESYDALILGASSCKIMHHLQVTQSFDGYQKHLRMLHLEEHGRAPLTGSKLQKDGATGRVPETRPEAVEHDQLLQQTFEHIRGAVQRKSQMRYEANTSLIVEFEDNHIHSESDRVALDSFARSILIPAAVNFSALYLVSDRQRLGFSYKTKAAPNKWEPARPPG